MNILNTVINNNDLVFDVGSNLGNKSQNFLNLGARVVAFEPQQNCHLYSLNRFKYNKNWTVENIALDNKKGKGILHIANAHTISSMSRQFIDETKKQRFQIYNWDNCIEIDTDTLDNMIEKYGVPSFIKIDAEGYELNILEGLTKSINFISFEFTPELFDNATKCIDYIYKINNNNALYNYGSRENENFMFKNWETKEIIINYLRKFENDKIEFGDIYCKKTN